MKQLSHTIVAILAISLVLVLFAGCGNASTNGQNSAQPYAGVHLTISRWSGPDADAMKTLLPEFTKETGIQVTMDAITYDNLQQKQVLDFSTHTGNYDLVWVPVDIFTQVPRLIFHPTLANYVNAFLQENFLAYFINSVIVATCTTALSMFLGTNAAYSLARLRVPGAGIIALG